MRVEKRCPKRGEQYIPESRIVAANYETEAYQTEQWVVVPDEPEPEVGTWAWALVQARKHKQKIRNGSCSPLEYFYWDACLMLHTHHGEDDVAVVTGDLFDRTDWTLYEPKAQTWNQWYDSPFGAPEIIEALDRDFPPPGVINDMVVWFSTTNECPKPLDEIHRALEKWQESRK